MTGARLTRYNLTMSAKLFSRSRKGSDLSVGQGLTSAGFNSDGVAEVTAASQSILDQFPDVYELGRVRLLTTEGMAGNTTATHTVPAGKFWRVLTAVTQIITDASVGNRNVTVTTQDSEDTEIESFAQANRAASGTQKAAVLFVPNADADGDDGVAAQGTITIAEPVTAEDTITVGDTVYVFINAADQGQEVLAGATHVSLGASEAETKANLAASLQNNSLITCPEEFTGDDLVVTAAQKGTAGDSLAFIEDLTHVSNVLDGSGTLGGTTAGVDFAEKLSALEWPDSILTAGEDIVISVATTADAQDVVDCWITVLEFDADPR